MPTLLRAVGIASEPIVVVESGPDAPYTRCLKVVSDQYSAISRSVDSGDGLSHAAKLTTNS